MVSSSLSPPTSMQILPLSCNKIETMLFAVGVVDVVLLARPACWVKQLIVRNSHLGTSHLRGIHLGDTST
jgi:hypothetical protein